MSVIGNNQPIVIPDPSDPAYGPSGYNVPVTSISAGNPVTLAIGNNSSVKFYTVAANLLPQVSGGQNSYRVTVNAFLDITTPLAGTVNGTVALIVGRRLVSTAFQQICGSTLRIVAGAIAGVNSYFPTASAVFVPSPGDTIEVLIGNYTGASLTLTLSTQQGSGIELVSRQTTQQLIFS